MKKVRINLKKQKRDSLEKIVIGENILNWTEGMKHKLSIDQWNGSLVMSSIITAGYLVSLGGVASNDEGIAALGMTTSITTLSLAAFNETIDSLSELNRSKLIPRTHLYRSFSIPKGLYIKRWILMEIKKENIPTHLFFNVEYEGGSQVEYRVKLDNLY